MKNERLPRRRKRFFFLFIFSLFSSLVNGQNYDFSIIMIGKSFLTHPGDEFIYTITVTNNGPDDAANVVVQMPTAAGYTATEVTCISGLSNNGSTVCPLSLDVSSLQTTGLIIPSLPDGGEYCFACKRNGKWCSQYTNFDNCFNIVSGR